MRNAPTGIDLAGLAAGLAEKAPGVLQGPLAARRYVGGRSNLTYLISDQAGKQLVLRRPPDGHLLATAHDMKRECRVMTALERSPVPAPKVVWFCDDPSVLGEPFYLMERVEGVAYRRSDELAVLGPTRTRRISGRMVDALVALHQVDPHEVGLDDFGRPSGFLTRQVDRWKRQLDASRSRDLPGIDDLHRRLDAAVPAERSSAIVHGDFRLDNLLIDDRDEVAAVLDWNWLRSATLKWILRC